MFSQGHSVHVIVVEDPMIQKLVHGILSRHGYSVEAVGASEASRRMRENSDILLVTNNPRLFLDFADIPPLLYVAAMPDSSLITSFRHCQVLMKPFHPKNLLAAVRELTG